MKIRTAAVSFLAVLLFGWFLTRANLGDVWAEVRSADVALLVASLPCIVAAYWARAARWQCLLAPIGPTRFRTAFRTTIIGFAALAVLPARAGDLLRPYLLAKQEGLSATATFATVVMERVLDLMTVVALLAVYLWGFADESTVPAGLRGPIELSSVVAGITATVLMALMWVLASHPERIGALVSTMAHVLPRRLGVRLGALASSFSGGFAVARQPRVLLTAVLWSVPIWLILGAEVWLVTRAFGIAMPFSGSFLLQALLVIGVAVPTPGGVGSFHEAYRIGVTTFFGAANDAAVAAAIVLHAVGFVPVVFAGLVFLAQDGLSMRRLQAMTGNAREEEMPDTHEMPVLRPSRR
jgi:uncharacterized protein (TIRG00374 family)